MALSDYPVTGRLDLEASSDAFRPYQFAITNLAGQPVTGWLSTDVITAQVWRGDSQPPLENTGVAVSWSNYATGTVRIVTDGTHDLTPSTYLWRLLVNHDSQNYEVCRGDFKVNFAPVDSTGTLPYSKRPYTTIEDLRTVAPWIDSLKTQYDQTDFMEQQLAARAWLDDLVGRGFANTTYYTTQYAVTPYPWQSHRDEVPPWLREVIATGNGIEITPRVRRAVACYAAHLVCAAQVVVKDDASAIRAKSLELRRQAMNIVTSTLIYVRSSLTATKFDIPIDLSISRRN